MTTSDPSTSSTQVVPDGFHSRLRAARKERGLSVRSLARAVGVSPSLISQIENGKATPSVAKLYGIVSALGISVDELFAVTAEAENEEYRRSEPSQLMVVRHQNRSSLNLETGVRWERLTPAHDAIMDFLLVTYEVGGQSCPPDALMRHVGREYGLVISGRLGATVGFESCELEPGDSIVADSAMPHRFWTIGDEPSVVVWAVVGRGGDPRAEFEP